MKLESAQIEFASEQIGLIDSGEKHIFLETVNTDKQIDANILNKGELSGVYFSCTIYDGVRIHISLNMDTDIVNEEISELIKSTLQKSCFSSCSIWIWNKNRKITEYLIEKFNIQPDGTYYYASIEFIMRRESFNESKHNNSLDIRQYEEEHIENYLSLLDGAMTFMSPPPSFIADKETYTRNFANRAENNSFESFWKDGELIGSYWRENAEIDIMAVAENQ